MIRAARSSDIKNLIVLSIEVWLHTYALGGIRASYSNYLLKEFTEEKFNAVISDPEQEIWLYENDKALQGFFILKKASPCPQNPDINTEIDSFYIHTPATRNGIGTALLSHALSRGAKSGIEQLWLSVQHQNQGAQEFYRKHNFKIAGSLMFELEDGKHKNHVLVKTISHSYTNGPNY